MTESSLWRCRDRVLDLGSCRVMGILNVTPDSFSDGGSFAAVEAALSHSRSMIAAGADIIDIGGESTRPGADPVNAENELVRVLPIVEALAAESKVLLSVDTGKAVVAEKCLKAGAHIINDVTALGDPAMLPLLVASGAGVVLMHMQGEPRSMQNQPHYESVVRDVSDYLTAKAQICLEAGVHRESIVVDPGIGFGKTLEHNLALLAGTDYLVKRGFPVLIGLSRKRMFAELCGCAVGERMAAGLGAMSYAAMQGAAIMRVHDVKETCDAMLVVDRLQQTCCHG